MSDIKALREALEDRIAKARAREGAAKLQVEIAFANAERTAREAVETSVDVERRLAAISLVEEMLNGMNGALVRPYAEMTQDDAMREVLRSTGKSLNSTELADMLKHGGYAFTSTNPANSIVVAANTNRKGYFSTEKEGNRTLIGLKEWIPEPPESPERDEEDGAYL